MSLEITGKLIKTLPEQSGEGRNGTWRKQEFVIETQDQYPKKICFTLWGDKIDSFSSFSEGAMLKVMFNLESREYNERWYTDAKAWRIEGSSNAQGSTEASSTPTEDPFPDDFMSDNSSSDSSSEPKDDLPF